MNLFENVCHTEKTDKGLKRDNNEDNLVVVDHIDESFNVDQYGILLAVADGMGGHAAGETASRMACEGLVSRYYFRPPRESSGLPPGESNIEVNHRHLVNTIHDINKEILTFGNDNEGYKGMGTTLSVLVLMGKQAVIAHVGDSRIYRLRDKSMAQLTRDHTEVQELIDTGRLPPENAATYHRRHILTQALGTSDELKEIYTWREEVSPKDIFLICSDGLYDMVEDAMIKTILIENQVPRKACDRLVETALENGGKDNVTVIVVRT